MSLCCLLGVPRLPHNRPAIRCNPNRQKEINVVDLESSESDSFHSTGDGSVVSDVSEPPSEAGDRLFTPSLSTQRHQKVLEVLREENAKSVLDMGRKIEFLSRGTQD